MAKRNERRDFEGKTLEQWQVEVNTYCKGLDARKCKQTIAETASIQHPANISNLDKNYRCYVARWATSQFYDRDPDPRGQDTQYDNHQKEIARAWSVVEDCLRFIQQEYARQHNAAKKEANRRKREEEEQRAMAKRMAIQQSATGDIKAVVPDLPLDSSPVFKKKFPQRHNG